MYLPKSQYKKINQSELPGDIEGLVNELGELFEKNKAVVLTAFGTIFDTAGIDFEKGDFSKAKQLFKQESEEDFDRDTDENPTLSSDKSIVALKLPPTSEDLKKGVMKRCFLRNKCTGDLREISKVQLTKLYRNTDKCIEVATIDWVVKGVAKDQIVNGYFLEGVETKNKKALQELNKIMPGVNTLIESPLEYIQEVNIPKSKSFKPQTNDIVIPSPGKRL